MKTYTTLFFCALLTISLSISCKERKATEVITPAAEVKTVDTADIETVIDSTSETKNIATDKPTVLKEQPSNKICAPNFNVISKPKSNTHFIYVSGFNPQEFKCWTYLEEHGHKICAGNICKIYYFDDPNVQLNATPPNYASDITLQTKGIARFESEGKNWSLRGSGTWKRKGKGYGYYNSNNY